MKNRKLVGEGEFEPGISFYGIIIQLVELYNDCMKVFCKKKKKENIPEFLHS